MNKLSMDDPKEKQALEEMWEDILENIQEYPEKFVLVPATKELTNEDVTAIAINDNGVFMPFAILVMPGDIVPRKTRTQKEIEERDKNREFELPEDARAEEYEAPLSLDDFEDDDPEVD